MRRIAVTNQKGGVGKTTTTANLAAALAQRGQRVLLIDLDPQAHLTTHFGLDASASVGVYELLTEPSARAADMLQTTEQNLTIVPARMDLAAAESELISVVGREVILRDKLAALNDGFDWLLIDCPPSFGVLTLNALSAVEEVLVPLQAHFLALQGVSRLLETVGLVALRINPALRVAGFVLCMYEGGTKLATEVVEDLQRFLADARGTPVAWSAARVFDSRIRRNIKLAECPSYGQSIFTYAPKSHGAVDYIALAEELAGVGDCGLKTQDRPEVSGSVPTAPDPVVVPLQQDAPKPRRPRSAKGMPDASAPPDDPISDPGAPGRNTKSPLPTPVAAE